jgi:hypothetical protein
MATRIRAANSWRPPPWKRFQFALDLERSRPGFSRRLGQSLSRFRLRRLQNFGELSLGGLRGKYFQRGCGHHRAGLEPRGCWAMMIAAPGVTLLAPERPGASAIRHGDAWRRSRGFKQMSAAFPHRGPTELSRGQPAF